MYIYIYMYAYDIQTPAFLGASGLGAKSLSGLPPC